jgi:glutamate-1-semialdehyde 2,1-aminomutase
MSDAGQAGSLHPHWDAAKAEMMAKTKKCQAMTDDREAILFSGMRANLNLPHPIYISHGEGAHVTDVDGNEYIDTCMGFGACVLGHQHPSIKQAIHRISDTGWHFGIHSQEQLPLAELMHGAVACAERLLFCNTGSEATGYAMRAARAFTGKEKIGIFDGYWHGMHDYCMVAPSPEASRDRPIAEDISAGVPKAVHDLIVPLPYRNPSSLDIIRENKDDLAMVIVEPVQHSNPQREVSEFLRSVQEVCRECDIVFLLDEMVTGFRIAYGGGQERFGITPDLATLGKACGGGFPIGVIAGREDIMRMFLAEEGRQSVFTGGTFTGNPHSMATGAAAVRHMHDHPEIYDVMETEGNRLTETFNSFCKGQNMPVHMGNVGSMFHIYFQNTPVNSSFDIDEKPLESAQQAFFLHTLNLGLLISGGNRYYMSAAHTGDVVDAMQEIFEEALRLVREDGLL